MFSGIGDPKKSSLTHTDCRMLLEGSLFMSFFEKVEVANFEVASDAFSTFKVCARLLSVLFAS